MMSTTIGRALWFAQQAHQGQSRKYTGEDYIIHPIRVARTVANYGGSHDLVCAALLHDVVEDTDFTDDDITREFGAVIAELVFDLTDASRPEDGNRSRRKSIDRAHLADGSTCAQFVKCADIIDNTHDIRANDPKFAITYLAEMVLLLEVLTKVAGTPIYEEAYRSVHGVAYC